MAPMKRMIYDEDHEAFRGSVREFLDREVRPHLEEHLADKSLGRDFWTAAGKQGFLGLEVPEEYGGAGAGDYRFNAVLLEELSHVNAALSSCVGIHADIVAPYLVELTTEEQRGRWLPGVASGELLTAIGMTEPSGGSDLAALQDHRRQGRRQLDHQRVQDVHHQRLLRRPRRGRGPHRAGEEGPRHHAVRRRHHRRGLLARPQARQGRAGGVRHRRAVLRERPGQRRRHRRRARQRLHPHDGEPARRSASAARSPTSRTPGRSWSRRWSTPRSARPSARASAPSSTTSSCSPRCSPRSTSPRPTSTSA